MTTLKVKTQNGGVDYVLDSGLCIGAGSEGEIYEVPGDDSRVIKIYKPNTIDPVRVDKLAVMVADPPTDPMRTKGHASIAWPEDLVISKVDGKVCGFVMPRLRDSLPISQFYNFNFRRVQLPFINYRSLCRIGLNLASAVWAIHDKGYVIGDINEGNIMANEKALVTLVDTDSFQIKENGSGRVFRCLVYTPLYTAPEFQAVKLDRFDRSPAQDLFGITVLLFQLLMEGQLPYACAFSNPGNAPDIVDCLINGYFPYAQKLNGMTPPPWAPPYSMLHPALQDLFDRCFLDGYVDPTLRPDAKTWHKALNTTENDLIACPVNNQHCYFNHLNICPWCERTQLLNAAQKHGNWDPFPQPGQAAASAGFQSGRGGSQRPISIPSVRPGVTPPGIPAQPAPVALKDIAVSLNAPMAMHSAQLALLRTLQLNQPQNLLLSPMRLTNHVKLDGHQPLNNISVDLNYATAGG